MPIRVGLSQRLEWLETRREMREMLDVAWSECLLRFGAQGVALPTRAPAPERLLRDYDLQALILTGGNEAGEGASDPASKERNAFEAALLRGAEAARVPVLGVCHGLQLMNTHLGGRVSRIAGHVGAPHTISGPAARLLSAPNVNTFHDTGIGAADLAAPLAAVGFAPDGSIEAAVHRKRDWLGIMWHPEREMPAGIDGGAALEAFLDDAAGLCARLREAA
jgi:putative glutamine amidotransferase